MTSSAHVIRNNGTAVVNISGIADHNAKDFMCGVGGTCTGALANVTVTSFDNETDACDSGLASTAELMTDETNNNTIGFCDRLNYDTSKDEIKVYYTISIPADVPTGAKTMTITYTAEAV